MTRLPPSVPTSRRPTCDSTVERESGDGAIVDGRLDLNGPAEPTEPGAQNDGDFRIGRTDLSTHSVGSRTHRVHTVRIFGARDSQRHRLCTRSSHQRYSATFVSSHEASFARAPFT